MGAIKQKLKDALPQPLVRVMRTALHRSRLPRNYWYDARWFARWSSVAEVPRNEHQLQALVCIDYHRIEKGLSLRSPRVWFGERVVKRLLKNIELYLTTYGPHPTVVAALSALEEYCRSNPGDDARQAALYEQITRLKSQAPEADGAEPLGGTVTVRKEDVLRACQRDLREFFESRASIRQFSEEPVDLALITEAVRMAQRTPSVCNRQPGRVHVLCSKEDKAAALACQSDNRGFGEEIDKLLIVTADLCSFVEVGERNQCWIDGGLFSMSLVYALHSLGLATCCLDWSADYVRDQQLRRLGFIPDREVVIMMIGVGHFADEFKIAKSSRRDIREVMFVRNGDSQPL